MHSAKKRKTVSKKQLLRNVVRRSFSHAPKNEILADRRAPEARYKIRFAKKGAPNLGFVRFPKVKLRSAKRGPSRSKTHPFGPKGSAEAVSKNRHGFRDPPKNHQRRKKGRQGRSAPPILDPGEGEGGGVNPFPRGVV